MSKSEFHDGLDWTAFLSVNIIEQFYAKPRCRFEATGLGGLSVVLSAETWQVIWDMLPERAKKGVGV